MDYDRYAVWWVPLPGTALARFGAEWTGWCADEGVVSSDPALSTLAGTLGGARRALVRRGLHASLCPPFQLAAGRSLWALEDALAELAERGQPILLPPLRLTVLEGSLALAIDRPDRSVGTLAAAVAEAVHPFARPLPRPMPGKGADDADGRRGPAPLDRLHLLLTGRLDAGRAEAAVAELHPRLAPVLARRHRVADLALVGDPGDGRPWRLLQRHPLAGEPARRDARVPAGMSWRGPDLLAPLAGTIATS